MLNYSTSKDLTVSYGANSSAGKLPCLAIQLNKPSWQKNNQIVHQTALRG